MNGPVFGGQVNRIVLGEAVGLESVALFQTVKATFFILVTAAVFGMLLTRTLNEKDALLDTLREQTVIDPLTGLHNRRGLERRISEVREIVNRKGRPFSVLYLDLDHFKPVNDTHGHDCGDEVLVTVAQRIRDTIRDSDFVARVGGDEFVLLVEDDAASLSARLKRVLSQPYLTRYGRIDVGASIGAVAVQPDWDTKDYLRAAEQRMYADKTASREAVTL